MDNQDISKHVGPSYQRPETFMVDERIEQMIAGAVAEIDPKQMAVLRRLTPAQRFQQAASMVRFAEKVSAYRLRLREPDLSENDAYRIIRSGSLTKRIIHKCEHGAHA